MNLIRITAQQVYYRGELQRLLNKMRFSVLQALFNNLTKRAKQRKRAESFNQRNRVLLFASTLRRLCTS